MRNRDPRQVLTNMKLNTFALLCIFDVSIWFIVLILVLARIVRTMLMFGA